MLRGTDSAGVAVIVPEVDTWVRRLPVSGQFLLDDKQFQKIVPTMRTAKAITIAHTRAATTGRVKMSNTHPFGFWDEGTGRELIGVHNGTLNGWHSKEGAKDYEVDSEWALSHIFEKGVDAFKNFYGAYCFVWWDSENPNKLNFARNDQRTMHVAFTKKGGLAYASEAGMLQWLADRRSIALDGNIKALKPGVHYAFDLEDIKKVVSTELPKNYTSTTTHRTNFHGTSTTVGHQVEEFLKKVMTEEKNLAEDAKAEAQADLYAAANGEKKPVVTREEMNDAKVMDILHQRVKFVPAHTDNRTDILYGTATVMENGNPWECDAIMRHASNVVWTKDEEMEVTVLGAMLTNNDAVLIISKPRVTLGTREEKSAAVH